MRKPIERDCRAEWDRACAGQRQHSYSVTGPRFPAALPLVSWPVHASANPPAFFVKISVVLCRRIWLQVRLAMSVKGLPTTSCNNDDAFVWRLIGNEIINFPVRNQRLTFFQQQYAKSDCLLSNAQQLTSLGYITEESLTRRAELAGEEIARVVCEMERKKQEMEVAGKMYKFVDQVTSRSRNYSIHFEIVGKLNTRFVLLLQLL